MATNLWCTINPDSGSGKGTAVASGTVHTGRLQRAVTAIFEADGAPDRVRTITQSAKLEFVTINNISATKDGGNVTITGKANSSKLTFALGVGNIPVVVPSTYMAGGASTNNGAAIAGDPGAAAEYDFAITVPVPANETVDPRSVALSVTAAGGQVATSTISQPAGDPVFDVSPEPGITLNANGEPVAFTIDCNTNWRTRWQ